jgi:hypothetical protein
MTADRRKAHTGRKRHGAADSRRRRFAKRSLFSQSRCCSGQVIRLPSAPPLSEFAAAPVPRRTRRRPVECRALGRPRSRFPQAPVHAASSAWIYSSSDSPDFGVGADARRQRERFATGARMTSRIGIKPARKAEHPHEHQWCQRGRQTEAVEGSRLTSDEDAAASSCVSRIDTARIDARVSVLHARAERERQEIDLRARNVSGAPRKLSTETSHPPY